MFIHTVTKKVVCLAMVLALGVFNGAHGGHHSSSSDTAANIVIGTVAAAAVIGTGYLTGKFCSWAVFNGAMSRYTPELDLLARASYNEQVIQEELIPYVLERHDRNNNSFFSFYNPYKNYPLLEYKRDLDWYINNLWFFKLFNLGTDKNVEVNRLMGKLERLRRFVVVDYRFVQEQREFDREQRERNRDRRAERK